MEEFVCMGELFFDLEEVELVWDGDMKNFIDLLLLEDLLNLMECS